MSHRVLIFVGLAACELATAPPAPHPPAPDPVRDAQQRFEPIDPAFAVGANAVYARGDLLGDDSAALAHDSGDFVGRLRTLFGPTPGNVYVLREKATGFVISAPAGHREPSFGGGLRFNGPMPPPDPDGYLDRWLDNLKAGDERITADPQHIAGPPPVAAKRDYAGYQRHLSDLRGPPGFSDTVTRLDALIEAVPPADWDGVESNDDDDAGVVMHVGVKHGASFAIELAAADAMTHLLEVANGPRIADTDFAFKRDQRVLDYYMAHRKELARFAPVVRAVWDRFARDATSANQLRAVLLVEAQVAAEALELPPSYVAAALR